MAVRSNDAFLSGGFSLHFVRVMSGPIDVSALMGMARVEAVLTAGYPGQRGGEAIANGKRATLLCA
eukprot:COSAG04_NODE_498_length_13385_cov_46.317853_15_plen_66_part_00